MVRHVPTRHAARESGIGAAYEFGPVTVVVVQPTAGFVLFDDQAHLWRGVGVGGIDGRHEIGAVVGRRILALRWREREIHRVGARKAERYARADNRAGIAGFEYG